MANRKKSLEELALAVASMRTDIASSKEHIAKQTEELEKLEKELSVATSCAKFAESSAKAPMILNYVHSDKIYRCRRSFDVYPFIYDFRMELYGTVVANISIVIRDKYLKESQFSNLRITKISPELSPEGVFKAAIKDYFNNHKQSKNTQEQIDAVFQALEIYITRNEDPEFDYMPREEIQLGIMKYVFKSKQVMPLPGQEVYGREGRLEITNTKSGAKSSASEAIESFEDFIRKCLDGVVFEVGDLDEFHASHANNVLLRYNMSLVKREGAGNLYKVVRKR
jgi:hypothetical protein